jgi:hypothetical protein
MEAHAVHVGLITRTPSESLTNRWEAEFWNGPIRRTRDYPTEDDLLADLRRTFGWPGGDEVEPEQTSARPDSPERAVRT